jgi:transglutaminase-like putative cysteine protease
MRLRVHHETRYSYEAPADAAIQVLRMTPRNHDGQFVKRWRVEFDADHRLYRDEDPFGNITHVFSVDGPIDAMRVTVEGEIETHDTSGLILGTAERLPLGLWLRESRLTAADPGLKAYAEGISSSQGGERLATLHALNRAIHRDMAFKIGQTDNQTSAAEAFAAKTGVCQDLAQIFVTCARIINVPARYVGGYFLRTDTEDQEAGHAWAEAFLHDIGWIGFDPTHGLCTTDRYIRIATGLDSLDAAPIRGARIGGFGEVLNVTVNVSSKRMLQEQ